MVTWLDCHKHRAAQQKIFEHADLPHCQNWPPPANIQPAKVLTDQAKQLVNCAWAKQHLSTLWSHDMQMNNQQGCLLPGCCSRLIFARAVAIVTGLLAKHSVSADGLCSATGALLALPAVCCKSCTGFISSSWQAICFLPKVASAWGCQH